MNDAIGNPIIIGNTYGYATNSDGFTQVTIGTVTKINESKATVKPILVKRSLYCGEPKTLDKSKLVSVQGMILFPVKVMDAVQEISNILKNELDNLITKESLEKCGWVEWKCPYNGKLLMGKIWYESAQIPNVGDYRFTYDLTANEFRCSGGEFSQISLTNKLKTIQDLENLVNYLS